MTDEEILEWDDKKLNQYVSLKKLAPYRDDQGAVNLRKIKKKKKLLSKMKKVKRTVVTENSRLNSYGL